MKRLSTALALASMAFATTASAECLQWNNLATGERETFCDGASPSDERLPEFLPQIPDAQGLYRVRIAQGMDPLDAYALTLLDVINARSDSPTTDQSL